MHRSRQLMTPRTCPRRAHTLCAITPPDRTVTPHGTVTQERYTDWWDHAPRDGREDANTEHSALDHMLVSTALYERLIAVRVDHTTRPMDVSDHWPIVATFSLNDSFGSFVGRPPRPSSSTPAPGPAAPSSATPASAARAAPSPAQSDPLANVHSNVRLSLATALPIFALALLGALVLLRAACRLVRTAAGAHGAEQWPGARAAASGPRRYVEHADSKGTDLAPVSAPHVVDTTQQTAAGSANSDRH